VDLVADIDITGDGDGGGSAYIIISSFIFLSICINYNIIINNTLFSSVSYEPHTFNDKKYFKNPFNDLPLYLFSLG